MGIQEIREAKIIYADEVEEVRSIIRALSTAIKQEEIPVIEMALGIGALDAIFNKLK